MTNNDPAAWYEIRTLDRDQVAYLNDTLRPDGREIVIDDDLGVPVISGGGLDYLARLADDVDGTYDARPDGTAVGNIWIGGMNYRVHAIA